MASLQWAAVFLYYISLKESAGEWEHTSSEDQNLFSESVFTAGDRVLTILYTASLSLGTQVGSVKLHSKAI